MVIIDCKTNEPEKYRWQAVGDNGNSIQRRGNGAENWVGLRKENAKGQYDFHILVEATLHQSSTLAILEQRIVDRLLRQRFEHPNIACTAFWDDQFGPLIRYTPPANDFKARQWAQESVQLRATSKGGLELRREIVARRKSENQSSRSFTVYLLGDAKDYYELLNSGSGIEILIHFNHIFWDGISARQFVGDLLRNLGQDYGRPRYDWGQEMSNLSPPVLDALKIDTQNLGKDYSDSLEEYMAHMFAFGSSHSVQIGTAPGLPATAVRSISPPETQKLIQAIKTRMGHGYKMTHLGQAATLLAFMKTSPPSQEALPGKFVIMPLPVNGRRYLRAKCADNQYGCCQACAVVVFDDLEKFAIDFDDKDAVLDASFSAIEITRSCYEYWLRKPFLLPLGIAKDNFISKMLEWAESKPDGKAVPIFVSDGKNNLYIPKTIHSPDGSLLASIDHVTFLTDSYQPGLLVRMEGWNGTTTLSLSYCDGSYSSREADELLECVKEFMMVMAA